MSENIGPEGGFAGCLGQVVTNYLIMPDGTETKFGGTPGSLCYDRPTVATLLDAVTPSPITWRYYAPTAGSIWTAPNSIQDICQPNSAFTQCLGAEWKDNVVLESPTNPAPVLKDIQTCSL